MMIRTLLVALLLGALTLPVRAQLVYSHPLAVFTVTDPVNSIDVTTDGLKLAVADHHNVSIFNLNTGYLVRVFEDQANRVLLTPKWVRFWPDSHSVLWGYEAKSLNNGSLQVNLSQGGQGASIAITRNRDRLAVLHKRGRGIIILKRTNPGLAERVAYFGANVGDNSSTPLAIDFSPDQSRIVEARDSGSVYLWNVNATDKDQPLLSFRAHNDIINSVQFNPVNGNQVLTSSWDGTARLWDLTTRKLIKQYSAGAGGIKCAIFSPDGKFVLTGDADGRARLWNTATGARLVIYYVHSQPVSCVAFTPDGSRVLTGSWDHTVRLWPIPLN